MRRMHRSRRRKREAGFTYVEVALSVVVLALALLGHASSTLAEHQMAEVGQSRSEALLAARQFIERLRADEDFAGLLTRVTALQSDLPGAGVSTLRDGRAVFAPSTYFEDFVLPDELKSLAVRVEVPVQPGPVPVLREDLSLPYYGLPADLNGDGIVDADSRNDDYRALPIRLDCQWTAEGGTASEFRMAAWLRGRR